MHLPLTQGALKPCVCPVPRFWELPGRPFLPFHAGTALIKPFLSALPFPTQLPINLPSPSHSFLCLHPCCDLSAAGHPLPQPTPIPFSQSSCSPGCLVLWPQETGSSTCSSQVELSQSLCLVLLLCCLLSSGRNFLHLSLSPYIPSSLS